MPDSKAIAAKSSGQDRAGFSIIMVECAVVFLVFQDVVVKLMAADMAVWQLQVIRSVVALSILIIGAQFFGGFRLFKMNNWRLHAIRGVCGFGAYSFYYCAVVEIPLAEASTLIYLAPIIATVMSPLILGEKLGLYRIAAVLTGFLGMLVVLQPGGDVFNKAALLAVVGAFFHAGSVTVMRYYRAAETTTCLAFYLNCSFLVFGLTGSAIGAVFFADLPPGNLAYPLVREWGAVTLDVLPLLLCFGLGGLAGHYSLAIAYRSAPIAIVAPFEYTYVVWAAAAGYVIWGEVPAQTAILGMALIVASGIFIAYREGIAPRKARVATVARGSDD